MVESVIDYLNLTRICEFTRALHQHHQIGGDEGIDREFNAVCRTIWGYSLDDFTDDDLSPNDHAWLDSLTPKGAFDFAARHGYDLKDYVHGGWVSDWWGFTWMILAEARGVLTPENRAAAWCKHDEKLMAETNVVGVIRGLGADSAPERVFSVEKGRWVLCGNRRVYIAVKKDWPTDTNNRLMGTLSPLKDVGVTWFREEDYPVLLEIFDDADKMPRTWNEWLKRAEQMEERAKAQGYRTQRVYIDPDSFADWCLCEGMGTDSEGRQKFALDAVAARYASKC